ncbi:MAG: P-type conjugative transfer protein TrbL [Candidatus Tectimicrobiota bacterium]
MDPGILTRLLNAFAFVFTGGFAQVMPEALWLLRTLAAIELVIVALWWALSQEDALVAFLAKALWIGAFVWLVTAWPTLTRTVVTSFMQTGLLAGGGGLSVADFTNPSTIASYGLQVTAVIFARISSFSGLGAVAHLPEVLLAGFSALGIVLAFFVMAIQVFVTLLEFYLVSMLALILVPFGVFRHTAFLAERAFGMILAFGVKLMVLACITSAMLPVLVTLQIPPDPAFKDILALLLASLALAMLTWHAPSVAAGMMAGAPSLTASTAAHTAIAAGAAVGLTAVAGATALRGVGAATRGALATGSAVNTAVRLGGAQGALQLAAGAGSDTVARATRGFRQAVASGRIYASRHVGGDPGNPPAAPPRRRSAPVVSPQRLLNRVVPPSAPPQGGLHAPLRPPD